MQVYTAAGTNSGMAATNAGNIWALASVMVKCAQKDNSCYTGKMVMDSAFANMCTADLDAAWLNFRRMYLDTKQHLIDSIFTHGVCSTAVTADELIAASHIPNFGEAKQAAQDYGITIPTSSSELPGLQQSAKNQASGYASDNCSSYINYWVQQLTSYCTSYPVDSINDVIIPRLLTVCKKGTDLTHPFGSSDIAPDSTSTYKSFQEVIAAYNASHGISDIYCNAYGITAPKPYNTQAALGNQPVNGNPDSCACSRVTEIFNKYQAVQADYSSFSDYLQQAYNTTVSQAVLDSLRQKCAAIDVVTACTNSTVTLSLPPRFQCNTGDVCITCEQYKSNYDNFTATYPGIIPVPDSLAADTAQLTKNRFFEQFMNYRLGFTKSTTEYLEFANLCSARLFQDSVNSVTDTCNRFTFIKTFGGTGVDVLTDIRQTFDGGYILAGNTTSFGNGGTDAYLIKTDNKGNVIWSKTYGGTANDDFLRIKQTADSGYVAVGTTRSFHQANGEVFVVKTKANGDVAWSKGFAQGTTNGEAGYDIIQTSEGGYALSGIYNFAGGVCDIEVMKLDNNGGITWAKKFGGTNSDNLGGIVEHADTLVFGGFTYSSAVTKVGGGSPAYTDYDALVVKMNKANGNIVWAKSYDLAGRSNWIGHIVRTTNGYRLDITNMNSYSGGNPICANLELDRNGNVIRNRQLTVPSGLAGMGGSATTLDGGYIATQVVNSGTAADPIIHLVNASGTVSWTNYIKRTGIQYFNNVTQNVDSSFAGAGVDVNDGLFVKTNRWGRTYCEDSIPNNPGTTVAVTSYNLAMTPTALTFSNTTISVIAANAATIQNNVCSLEPCAVAGAGPTLCGRAEPLFPPVSLDSVSNCMDSTFFAVSSGRELFKVYKDSLNNSFDSSYRALCMQAYRYESFTVTHQASEYHYTLYYYDQAGALVRTIPPAGVDLSRFEHAAEWSEIVSIARANKTVLKPPHFLKTDYRYNTLNQVVAQQTPDAGISRFWYDRLGRIAVSQNAKQKAVSGTEAGRKYSYTLYDGFGRITEVGQLTNATGDSMIGTISRSPADLGSWLDASAANKEQITTTVYDLPYAGFTGISPQPIVQRNLRNRVSYMSIAHGANPAQYNQASFYTYDALGNVDTLLQDYGASDVTATQNVMNVNSNRFKRIVYRFDLISGKVNAIAYQPNQADQFYHRYTYDAENRIILAETSDDSIHWEKDARYKYYKHGPLARTVLGEQQVQGLDYAYTLQGWLKGVNSSSLEIGYDMGRDGDTTWINRYVARDAFGFNLGYYAGDYTPINSTITPFPGYSAYLGAAYKPLFNGNISSMVVNIGQFNNPMLYAYTYDQLNRFTGMDAHTGFNQSTNSWSGLIAIDDYNEKITYDLNGNIRTLKRNGVSSINLNMDNMTYVPFASGGKMINNRVRFITDTVNKNNYTTDINLQFSTNYQYDAIGNLVEDKADSITNVTWNVYGKIQEIQRNATDSNPTVNIKYTYDALGNRISKQVTDNSGNVIYTWYARDAQGNVMSTYISTGTGSTLSSYTVDLSEQYLYGSSRLGVLNRSVNMKTAYTQEDVVSFYRGYKLYELSNHLGNVWVTITDKKTGASTNGTTVDNYTADVGGASDYYPGGMGMPGRTYSSGTPYRYSINGQEKTPEVAPNTTTAEFWQFDARIIRRWNGDPLTHKFSWQSPYAAFDNNPINKIDPDGRAAMSPIYGTSGKFLGTDDQGLQGEAIVMHEANFKQGMTHNEAMAYNLGSNTGLMDTEAKSRMATHYAGLSKRPDYDGKITFAEAIKWYNNGTGEALYVDAEKINLSSINTTIFDEKSNSLSIEFFPIANKGEQNHYPHPETGPVYGHIQVTLLDAKTGKVRLGLDAESLQKAGLPPMTLDIFDFKKGSTAGKVADYLYPGKPKDFNIIMYNNTTKIKTAQDTQIIRDNINGVIME